MADATHGFRRIWLVLCDHSVVGVWKTKLEAERAIGLRQRQTISNVIHFLLGPFVLGRGASAEKRVPEWISRCSCGAAYRKESEWAGLAYVGVMDFDDGFVLELRNCVACGSTISRRVSLKGGAKKRKGVK